MDAASESRVSVINKIREWHVYGIKIGYNQEPESIPSTEDIRAWVAAGFRIARESSYAGYLGKDPYTSPDVITAINERVTKTQEGKLVIK